MNAGKIVFNGVEFMLARDGLAGLTMQVQPQCEKNGHEKNKPNYFEVTSKSEKSE